MRYGDETLDVPCITGEGVTDPRAMAADALTALEWAKGYIEKHDVPCSVRRANNPHDFGTYPSLEVDYHVTSCSVIEDGGDCMGCEDCDKRDKEVEAINVFTDAYRERFKDHL